MSKLDPHLWPPTNIVEEGPGREFLKEELQPTASLTASYQGPPTLETHLPAFPTIRIQEHEGFNATAAKSMGQNS